MHAFSVQYPALNHTHHITPLPITGDGDLVAQVADVTRFLRADYAAPHLADRHNVQSQPPQADMKRFSEEEWQELEAKYVRPLTSHLRRHLHDQCMRNSNESVLSVRLVARRSYLIHTHCCHRRPKNLCRSISRAR